MWCRLTGIKVSFFSIALFCYNLQIRVQKSSLIGLHSKLCSRNTIIFFPSLLRLNFSKINLNWFIAFALVQHERCLTDRPYLYRPCLCARMIRTLPLLIAGYHMTTIRYK